MADSKDFAAFADRVFSTAAFTVGESDNVDVRYDKDYKNGDYTLPEGAFDDLEKIGEFAREAAKGDPENGVPAVNLMDFPETRAAAGWNGYPTALSNYEIGCAIYGAYLAKQTSYADEIDGEIITHGTARFDHASTSTLANLEIGRRVAKANNDIQGDEIRGSEGLDIVVDDLEREKIVPTKIFTPMTPSGPL